MEGLKKNRAGQILVLAGVALLAAGGIFYAVSLQFGKYGLYVCGAGALLLLAGAVVSRGAIMGVLGSRYGRMGITSGAAVVVVLALALFAGSLATRHHKRWDLSEGQQHSLAAQTVKVLKKLSVPVKAYAFFRDQDREQLAGVLRAVNDMFGQYSYHNPKFTYEIIDPIAQPGMAREYDIRLPGTVVLVNKDKSEKVTEISEKSLTNALVRVTAKGKKKVYFLTLHGEKQIDDVGDRGLSNLAKALKAQGNVVEKLNLATSKGVPDDAACLVIPGPTSPLDQKELDRISAYLKKGGGVAVMLDPLTDGGMTKWLTQYGVDLGDNFVLDPRSQEFRMQPWVVVAAFSGASPILTPLEGQGGIFQLVRMAKAADRPPKGVEVSDLFHSSDQSWAETDLTALTQKGKEASLSYDKGKDIKGPISLAASALVTGEKPANAPKGAVAPKGRLVVFGDSEWLINAYLKIMANGDLALNTVNYLALESDLISIQPKGPGTQPLMLTHTQAQLVMWIPVVVIPLFFVILGIVVWTRRRSAA